MHQATQEVERRVAEILKQNPSLYGRRVVLKAVQAQVQIELLHDISAKLDAQQCSNAKPGVTIPGIKAEIMNKD